MSIGLYSKIDTKRNSSKFEYDFFLIVKMIFGKSALMIAFI